MVSIQYLLVVHVGSDSRLIGNNGTRRSVLSSQRSISSGITPDEAGIYVCNGIRMHSLVQQQRKIEIAVLCKN